MVAFGFRAHGRRPLLLGSDAELYAKYAGRIMAGEVPYRDFFVEYPPLSLPIFAAPKLLAAGGLIPGGTYGQHFGLLMLALALGVGALVRVTCRTLVEPTERHASFVFAVAAFLLTPVLLWRYDIAPTLCLALALLAFLRGRDRWSGVALGLGVAAKLYPMVVGPVLLAERVARRDGERAAWLVLGGIVALGITVLPFAVLAPTGLGRVLGYHAERGVQVESVLGGIILVGARFGWTEADLVTSHGAHEIVSTWAAAAPYLPLVTVVALLLTTGLAYARFRQDLAGGKATAPAVVGYVTLALLVFLVTSKVLSPQFLVWLLPVVPLLPRRHSLPLLGACLLGALLFPWRYWELLRLESPALMLLNARNALLVVASVAILREHLPALGQPAPEPLRSGSRAE